MALVINGTSIPTSGKVVCNGTSLKQLNIGGTKVWNSGIDLIAANNWTKTSSQDGFWGSSTSQLWLRAQWRTDWWNWIIVRSAALNLTGYTQITLIMGQQRRKRPELDRLWRVFYECESDAG